VTRHANPPDVLFDGLLANPRITPTWLDASPPLQLIVNPCDRSTVAIESRFVHVAPLAIVIGNVNGPTSFPPNPVIVYDPGSRNGGSELSPDVATAPAAPIRLKYGDTFALASEYENPRAPFGPATVIVDPASRLDAPVDGMPPDSTAFTEFMLL